MPFVTWLYGLGANTVDGLEPGSLVHGLSSLGFAGLVWYLLAVRDPKREEREEQARIRHAQRLDERDAAYKQNLKEVVESIGKRFDENTTAKEHLVAAVQQLGEKMLDNTKSVGELHQEVARIREIRS